MNHCSIGINCQTLNACHDTINRFFLEVFQTSRQPTFALSGLSVDLSAIADFNDEDA